MTLKNKPVYILVRKDGTLSGISYTDMDVAIRSVDEEFPKIAEARIVSLFKVEKELKEEILD